MATDFSRLTVLELRQELKKRNLPQTGKKADLIDRLATFENESESSATVAKAAATEPADNPDDGSHDAHASAQDQSTAAPQTEENPNPPQQDRPEDSLPPAAAEDAPQPSVDNQDLDGAPSASNETSKPAEDSATTQAPVAAGTEDKTAETEPVAPAEIITDAASRKRRSRSPPPENESVRKRARPSDETGEGDIFESRDADQPSGDKSSNNDMLPEAISQDAAAEAQPVPVEQTESDSHAATRETSQYNQSEQHPPTQEADWRQGREPTPPRYHERQDDAADEPMADNDRDVEPAQHPATSALYIKNFMRPLREPVLRDYLIDLAALPGAGADSSCLVDFHLDQIRTHSLVSFTSVSAASRVRTALHGTVWPNERNRKELWVDFVPEDKVAEWIERERSEGGRSSRWEVHYERDDNGDIVANLVNAEMELVRRNSNRQPLGPPPVPTGPARSSFPGVEGAPLGPRGRGTNHYRQGPMPPPPVPTAADDRDYDRRRAFRTTRTDPPLQYKPVSEDVAQRRLSNINAHITTDRHRDVGRPDEINRYTFEDGETFVDRGKEAFIGIRPPHRERERRRMGIGRGGGGGNRGPPPPRRRSPSPRRPFRDDDGYRGGGGGGRDDYDRYRDRDDDRRDRFRDDVPRSRFDGQPLPTFNGGGGRGGRRGGGRRDRY